jgi:hypothetical protein
LGYDKERKHTLFEERQAEEWVWFLLLGIKSVTGEISNYLSGPLF